MTLKNKNDYYNVEDELIFGRLERFNKFNSKTKEKKDNKSQHIKYSNSDKNYFNQIIKKDEKFSLLNESDINREINYYKSSDFKKFEDLNKFTEYKTNLSEENNNNKSLQSYTSKDRGQFDNIIKTENKDQKILKDIKQNVKIIDYGKLKNKEKLIKNKAGIEKIKVVFFD